MAWFVLSFLIVYSAMHAVVLRGVYPLLTGHPFLPALAGLWMAAMVVSPILVRLLDGAGHEQTARAVAWIGYGWMGLLFLAFCLFAILQALDLLALALGRALPALSGLTLRTATSAAACLLVTSAVGIYGFFEAANLRVETVRLTTEKLPPGIDELRIAQVSDLHLGLVHRDEALAPVISAVRELEPDLLVASGDIVDAQMDHLEALTALWQRLDLPLGKFAVTGNHEYYAGLEQGLDFLVRSGFTVLRNEAVTVADTLVVAGVDDPAGSRTPDDAAVLGPADTGTLFTVLLKHRPWVSETATGLFDLQLSGHTHRGQIFPFHFFVRKAYPYFAGLYPLSNGAHLYVSRGTGTWGPPMRVLAPPEVTLFVIARP
ncbi:MAG: metallophosphoesterase [Deferrisomatales bacterium]|nr:metallophosphoesterase [Deferrisomatales bacterium]